MHDDDGIAWLEALVWPGEHERLDLLRKALNVAREAPPVVSKGDLRTHLRVIADQAPSEATLVIFHSAVLAYIESEAERIAVADTIAHLHVVWISNEVPAVQPCVDEAPNVLCPPGQFLLVMDNQPIACADPHGTFVRWL